VLAKKDLYSTKSAFSKCNIKIKMKEKKKEKREMKRTRI
jgi:hypothetical protein